MGRLIDAVYESRLSEKEFDEVVDAQFQGDLMYQTSMRVQGERM